MRAPGCVAVQEAQEIFGDVNGLLEAYAARRGAPTAASDDDDDDGLDEEAFQVPPSAYFHLLVRLTWCA